jgi:hypothetical protein
MKNPKLLDICAAIEPDKAMLVVDELLPFVKNEKYSTEEVKK